MCFPNYSDKTILVNDIADFFVSKIDTIRSNIDALSSLCVKDTVHFLLYPLQMILHLHMYKQFYLKLMLKKRSLLKRKPQILKPLSSLDILLYRSLLQFSA